jgi:hypothetical protein
MPHETINGAAGMPGLINKTSSLPALTILKYKIELLMETLYSKLLFVLEGSSYLEVGR